MKYLKFIDFLLTICTDDDTYLEVFDMNMRKYVWRGTRGDMLHLANGACGSAEAKEYLHRYVVKEIYPLVATTREGIQPVLEININLR